MAIPQISSSNTFSQWLTATQALIDRQNYYQEFANLAVSSANSASNSANAAGITANNINIAVQNATNYINVTSEAAVSNIINTTSNTYSTYLLTIQVYNDTANLTNLAVIYANNAYDTANLALDTINVALETSETALNVANAALANVNSAVELSEALLANVPVIFAFANASFDQANSAFDKANLAYDTANSAFDEANNTLSTVVTIYQAANNTLNVAQDAANTANFANALATAVEQNVFSIIDDTTTANTYYPSLLLDTTGVPNKAYVSSTKLYYVADTGQLSATNFNSLSDLNKKNNIITLENALDSVMNLRGVSFTWKDTQQKAIGVIAQEIETIVPEVVSTNENGEKSVSYGNIVGLLIQAIKELKKEVNDLKDIINKINTK